ncbi:gem-associated protein 5 [Bicyclus anynana]|uniref:Gem-associated protein 5 n=1 Tax=Bicyclus anynana TaxID=110368 RepID=A0ABM3LGC0_BICAN|nr:gem-associated protein 5 [Bicyclus anynana]
MNETIVFPSPNWFQVSGIAVSSDGWLIYGGPSKSICVLQPLNSSNNGSGNQSYQAHVVTRGHSEKIACVDISPDWPKNKFFITGSVDGSVKQWSLQSVEHAQNDVIIKSTHSLDVHQNEKEVVAGIGYSNESCVISVGVFGNIVKWDLKSNVAKTNNKFLRKFKPSCMACSPHVPFQVAVGTKQGVVFVIDLSGQGNVVYKIRAQDDDIATLSWCPQYEVLLKRSFKESIKKSNEVEKLKIKDEINPNDSGVGKNLPDDSFDESIVQEDDTFDIYKDHEPDEFGHKKFKPQDILVKVVKEKEPNDFLAECMKLKEDILKIKNESEQSVDNLVEALDKTHVDSDEDSSDTSQDDNDKPQHYKGKPRYNKAKVWDNEDLHGESSAHVQKHLLATIGSKYGSVKIWSKSGKMVACSVVASNIVNKKAKGPNCFTLLWYKPNVLLIADGKSQLVQCNPLIINWKKKIQWSVVHTLHKRGLYAIATNAPRLQSPDKSGDESSDCPPDQWRVWTAGQDRNLICYNMVTNKKVGVYNTCGGFIYTVQSCPYDAKSVAMSVGDGAVRIWEADTSEDDTKLTLGQVTSFWQNVQGKVLTLCWHPTKENLLAFATGESRVGLIDAGGKTERPARTLATALRGGIYSMCWGHEFDLYVAGGGQLVRYCVDKPDKDPVTMTVEFEGQKWSLSAVSWHSRGMLCGSDSGGVALLEPYSRELVTAAFVFSKMIHSMEWHPQQTSGSSEESPYKDLIAVSSLDKSFDIVIVEYVDKGDGLKLHKWKSLNGHTNAVLQLVWNPHKDALLLSTSHDSSIRVWDVLAGTCIAIFGRHVQSSLGATWSALPQLSSTVLSGGADCCLRVWRVEDYPPETYTEVKHEIIPKKLKKKKVKKDEENEEAPKETDLPLAAQVAARVDKKFKAPKQFLLATLHKSLTNCSALCLRKMAERLIQSEDFQQNQTNNSEKTSTKTTDEFETIEVLKPEDIKSDTDDPEAKDEEFEVNEVKETEDVYVEYWKVFGNTNDLNEMFEFEMQRHVEQGRLDSCIMLSIFRGHIDAMIQFASQRNALCPFLVSLSPCVSFKYWKDVTQLYLAQIERMVATGQRHRIGENKSYGGSVYRRAALMLSLHDLRGAVTVLVDADLFPEAYMLAKARHVDALAEEVLHAWKVDCFRNGRIEALAMCYLALGNLYKAATTLVKSNKQEFLTVAAELAKALGQDTFATHIEDKKSLIVSETPEQDPDEDLKPLPSKIDLMKHSIEIDGEDSESED